MVPNGDAWFAGIMSSHGDLGACARRGNFAAVVLIFMTGLITLTVMLENMGMFSNAQRAFLTEIGNISQPLTIAVCVTGFIGVLWLAANFRRLIKLVLLALYRFVNPVI